MTRFSAFRYVSLTVISILLGSAGCGPATERTSFTVALLPDTQNYSDTREYRDKQGRRAKRGWDYVYVAQTQWIRDRAKQDNIKFAIHLGDIVQHAGREDEWQNADRAHRILDGTVPYSVVPGNHDLDHKVTRDEKGIKISKLTWGTRLYNKYFPPSRFKNRPWYGGHMGEDNTNNYCFFEGGGMKFMVLSLEFAPRDKTLEWASKIVRSHKDRRVIVATHYYLRPEGRPHENKVYGLNGNVGDNLWNKFVRKHENIFMVVCGHVLGVNHQTSVNDAGKTVHEILCDYQGFPNGGDGWLQTLRFEPAENKIHVVAYSPKLEKYNTEPKHTYTLDYDMSTANTKKAR